ncbi:MAG: HU family DNA-binding protein [Deltaproteobacteria bacterium]|nr:HU family DNA-binding protein [Deltaproteobacteria bacterium]
MLKLSIEYRKSCYAMLESLLSIIKDTLASGETMMISGFGKFSVKQKRARKGRNPVSGEEILFSKRKIVTFQYSWNLRES